jgi:hypothetical protein
LTARFASASSDAQRERRQAPAHDAFAPQIVARHATVTSPLRPISVDRGDPSQVK